MCSVVGSPWGLDDPKESLLGFGDEGRDSGELIGVSLEARLEWIGAMATSGPPSLPLDVACLLVCLYRRVSTRERFGVCGRLTAAAPLYRPP